MNYKLIFCDLDETLLDRNRAVPPANIEAIRKARTEYGMKFVCATGRHFSGTYSILKALDLYGKENEYVCSLNGALISENKDDRLIHTAFISGDRASRLIQFALDRNVCIELYTLKNLYIYNLNDEERKVVHQIGVKYIEVLDGSYDFMKEEPVLKMAFQSDDFAYLHQLEGELQEFLGGDVVLTYSSNRYMELNSKNASKGTALKKLADYLKIDISETIAIGDHYNDIAMLKAAGLAVAAQNAQDGVKQICDYVTEKDHNEGVVAEVLEKFVFHL